MKKGIFRCLNVRLFSEKKIPFFYSLRIIIISFAQEYILAYKSLIEKWGFIVLEYFPSLPSRPSHIFFIAYLLSLMCAANLIVVFSKQVSRIAKHEVLLIQR